MPLIRKIPKRGFNNARFKVYYLPVNVALLNNFEDGAVVDPEAMKKAGLANGNADGIKILSVGDLEKKLTVKAHAFSDAAIKKIEAAGGSCEIISNLKIQDKKKD